MSFMLPSLKGFRQYKVANRNLEFIYSMAQSSIMDCTITHDRGTFFIQYIMLSEHGLTQLKPKFGAQHFSN